MTPVIIGLIVVVICAGAYLLYTSTATPVLPPPGGSVDTGVKTDTAGVKTDTAGVKTVVTVSPNDYVSETGNMWPTDKYTADECPNDLRSADGWCVVPDELTAQQQCDKDMLCTGYMLPPDTLLNNAGSGVWKFGKGVSKLTRAIDPATSYPNKVWPNAIYRRKIAKTTVDQKTMYKFIEDPPASINTPGNYRSGVPEYQNIADAPAACAKDVACYGYIKPTQTLIDAWGRGPNLVQLINGRPVANGDVAFRGAVLNRKVLI